jgi:ADP-ribosylglycohydrolase
MSFPMASLLGTVTNLTVQGNSLTVTHAHRATHVSTLAIAAAVIGALVVLACLAWAIARTLTFEPRWMLSLRHAGAEAGFRASATWAEFSDWVRLGR